MVQVGVQAEQGRFFTVLKYESGYKFTGEEFAEGKFVEGRFEGERAAERDAADWRAKLVAAGVKVE
jgi:hypothetical protein